MKPNLIRKQNSDFGCIVDLSWSKLMFDTYHTCDGNFDEKIWLDAMWTSHDQINTYHNNDCKFDKGENISDLGCAVKFSQWTFEQEMRREGDRHSSKRHKLNEAFLAS
jgi:hypothetical protein